MPQIVVSRRVKVRNRGPIRRTRLDRSIVPASGRLVIGAVSQIAINAETHGIEIHVLGGIWIATGNLYVVCGNINATDSCCITQGRTTQICAVVIPGHIRQGATRTEVEAPV